MKTKIIIALSLVFFLGNQFSSALQINELMPCNLSTYMERDFFNFSGYMEVYNDTKDSININSWKIVHYKLKKNGDYEMKWIWNVDRDIYFPPHSYSVLWMDEQNKRTHAPYKLDADGGYVLLYNQEQLVDSLAYGEMNAHIAYGRYAEESGYMEPTPFLENTLSYGSESKNLRCKKVNFDVTPGLVEEPFYLKLTSNTSDAKIYYTTDGTEPSQTNGELYDSPIYVDKNLTIRTRAYDEFHLPSKINTATYLFLDDRHERCGGYSVPIVSIVVDSLFFYDDSVGIYVKGVNGVHGEKNCVSSKANYNREWKRPVNFEYIVDGVQVLSQEIEAEVEGGCSRTNTYKSLSLKASKKSGDKDFDYYFFQSKPDIKHQTIYLRNGGTAYNKVRFRDGLMQSFAINMNIDYQAYQPVAFYLNGKYIGLFNLNERTNVDYLKANYNLEEDEVDLITISDQLGVRASKGDKVAYDELVNYLSTTDASDSSYFKGACERMDMDEYMDYQVFQQFIVNTDWPGNNTKIWRERKEGSKFRWILMDTDFGLGLSGYEYLGSFNKNMLTWCQGTGPKQWANSATWMTKIFSSLSKNLEFRKKFVARFRDHLSTTFSNERIETVFDSITAIVDMEYCATFNTSAVTATTSMKNFALNRELYIQKQLTSYLGETDVQDHESPLTLFYFDSDNNKLSLMSEDKIHQVFLYASNGQLLRTWAPTDEYYLDQDLSQIPNGVYILHVVCEKGVSTKQFIKR